MFLYTAPSRCCCWKMMFCKINLWRSSSSHCLSLKKVIHIFVFFGQREAGEEIRGVSVSCFLWWGCQSDPFQSYRTPDTRTHWKWYCTHMSKKIILIDILLLEFKLSYPKVYIVVWSVFFVCMLRATGRRREQLVAHSTGQQFLLRLFQCSFQSNDPFITWHFFWPGQRPSQT